MLWNALPLSYFAIYDEPFPFKEWSNWKQLEQCDSSPFVGFVNREMVRKHDALIEISYNPLQYPFVDIFYFYMYVFLYTNNNDIISSQNGI